MQNLSYENEFDLHLNGLVNKPHFHMKGFALGLVLKQRQRELGNGLLRSFHRNRTDYRNSFKLCPLNIHHMTTSILK